MDDHFDVPSKGVKGRLADDGAGVGFVDCHMWLGAEKTSGVHFYRIEDSGFVGVEDLGVVMRHAWMVDVKEARGWGRTG